MIKKLSLTVIFTLAVFTSFAQVKIKGLVYDEYLEPFYNARVNYSSGDVTSNVDGEFSINTKTALPITITVSAFGFQTETIKIIKENQKINIILKENLLLDQVVISASRTPERIIEFLVTIERLGLREIKRGTSNSFYDGLTNLKGIESREISYGLKSINTRGFSDFSNSRFVQLVDGMDTAAPALNFSTGNLSGVSDLDINNVEILPDASSALYGANAYNGIMLLNTKNPFDFSGVSFILKSGNTYQEAAGNNAFYDVNVRMAYKFSDYFAAKVNFSYYEAEEWHATDFKNKEIDTNEIIEGSVNTVRGYDGANTYGDEVFRDLSVFNQFLPADQQITTETVTMKNWIFRKRTFKRL